MPSSTPRTSTARCSTGSGSAYRCWSGAATSPRHAAGSRRAIRAARPEVQHRAGYLLCEGWLLTAEGRPAEGLAAFREALALEDRLQPRHPFTKYTLIGALEAALAVPDLDAASELLDLWEAMRPVDRTPLLEAHWERARAALAVARGDADSAEPSLAKSLEIFRKLEMPYDVGTSLVAQAEWLVGRDREAEAEPLVAEAREIFQRLRARPMLERLAALESRGAAVSA